MAATLMTGIIRGTTLSRTETSTSRVEGRRGPR
jgi:hypothetical protein